MRSAPSARARASAASARSASSAAACSAAAPSALARASVASARSASSAAACSVEAPSTAAAAAASSRAAASSSACARARGLERALGVGRARAAPALSAAEISASARAFASAAAALSRASSAASAATRSASAARARAGVVGRHPLRVRARVRVGRGGLLARQLGRQLLAPRAELLVRAHRDRDARLGALELSAVRVVRALAVALELAQARVGRGRGVARGGRVGAQALAQLRLLELLPRRAARRRAAQRAQLVLELLARGERLRALRVARRALVGEPALFLVEPPLEPRATRSSAAALSPSADSRSRSAASARCSSASSSAASPGAAGAAGAAVSAAARAAAASARARAGIVLERLLLRRCRRARRARARGRCGVLLRERALEPLAGRLSVPRDALGLEHPVLERLARPCSSRSFSSWSATSQSAAVSSPVRIDESSATASRPCSSSLWIAGGPPGRRIERSRRAPPRGYSRARRAASARRAAGAARRPPRRRGAPSNAARDRSPWRRSGSNLEKND